MPRRIAFFDFDGTITTRDTLPEILSFHRGKIHFYMGLLINAPILLGYTLGLIPNYSAKQCLFRYFLRNQSGKEFQTLCDQFSRDVLPFLLRPKAIKEIQQLLAEGTRVVIVSSSAAHWISQWTASLGIPLLATRLEIKNERLTGRIAGRNCYGAEKVNRIREAYDLSAYDEIYCYGDSHGDKEMLALGIRKFYKPFR